MLLRQPNLIAGLALTVIALVFAMGRSSVNAPVCTSVDRIAEPEHSFPDQVEAPQRPILLAAPTPATSVRVPTDQELSDTLLSLSTKNEAGQWLSYCVLEHDPAAERFSERQHIYVAPAEAYPNMMNPLQYVDQHAAQLVARVRSLASVVGSMSVLHVLARLSGLTLERIDWFDINCHALDHGQLMIDLFTVANSRRDVVTMFFARDLDHFLASHNFTDLTMENQHLYMALPPSEGIRNATRSRLRLQKNRRIFDLNIVPLQSGELLPVGSHQRMVLPILDKMDHRLTNVIFGGYGDPSAPDYVPNRGSLYYGVPEFFLGSDQAFTTVQTTLRKARHHFHVFNLGEDAPERIMPTNATGDVMLFLSNVPFFLKKYSPYTLHYVANLPWRWARPVLRSPISGRVLHLLAAGEIESQAIPRRTDPHLDVLMRMHAMLDFPVGESESPLRGPIVEVIADALLPRGMTEFPRTVIGHSAYLALKRCEAAVTVLHILVGERAINKTELRPFFDKAVRSSRYVLVMEHNAASSDFKERVSELFTLNELHIALGRPQLLAFDYCDGKTDHVRNMLLLVSGQLMPNFPHHYTCAFP